VWAALIACTTVTPVRASSTAKEIRQDLFSACFLNAHEGWIVGERGRVFHTADGGEHFSRLPTGTRKALLSVACFPNKRLVVVGQKGTALHSTDGGKTWDRLETGTERNLLGVDFATETTGVAVGDYGTIVRTGDGGRTWTTVPVPEEIPLPEDVAEVIMPGDILLYDVDFPSAERGWIVGEFGTIFATNDAGRSWTAQKSPVETTLFGVFFADEQNGWAVGLESALLHTTDGGETWTAAKMRSRGGFVLSLYDVAVGQNIGWAIGDSGFLLRSADSGKTWKQVALPIDLAGDWLRGVSITPDQHGFIVGAKGLVLATAQGRLRRVEERAGR